MRLSIKNFQNQSSSTRYLSLLLLMTFMFPGLGLLGGGDFWWSDESRHAMDGVYFFDLVRDRPFLQLYEYTERYFAKYPALALTWYPPFFAITEAIFYRLFGISVTTAKLTVIFFALFGVFLWYRLIKKIYNPEVAFYSGLLFITTPLVVGWSRAVMLEIPTTTMIMLCVYCFYHYFELGKKKYAYYLALSLCGALYTKQTAGFMLPLFLSYVLFRKKYRQLFQKECLFSYGILAIFLTPLAVFTMKFGSVGMSIVLGDLKKATTKTLILQWTNYLRILPDNVLTWPVLLLALVSIGVLAYNRKERSKSLLFLLWIAWWYIYCSYLFGHTVTFSQYGEYYGIYVVPPFCLFAILAFSLVKNVFSHKAARFIPILGSIALCVYQGIVSCNVNISVYIDNVYDDAAKFVVQHPKGATVLLSADYDGNFIFHVRQHDVTKKMVILRADKMLVSFSVFKKWGLTSYVSTEEDIYAMLRDYGTGYVVIEDRLRGEDRDIKALEMLREMVDSENFTLVKRLQTPSTFGTWLCCPYKRMRDTTLLIYEYNHRTVPQARELVIKFPQLQREIRLPLELLADDPPSSGESSK